MENEKCNVKTADINLFYYTFQITQKLKNKWIILKLKSIQNNIKIMGVYIIWHDPYSLDEDRFCLYKL